jgi:hypothetical protein
MDTTSSFRSFFSILDHTRQQATDGLPVFLGFISAVGDSIKGRKISEPVDLSPHCSQLLQLLAALRQLADDVAPADMLQAGVANSYQEFSARFV